MTSIASRLKLVFATFVLVSAVVSHFREFPAEGSGDAVVLGDLTYDMKTVSAPVVTGQALRAVSWVATRSVVGPFVLRYLLVKNNVGKLRELADQLTETAPLHHPIYRMNDLERADHDRRVREAVDEQTDLSSLVPFVTNEALLDKLLSSSSSTVLELHALYKSGGRTPTGVARTVLDAIERLNPVYRAFSAEPNTAEILASAKASSDRYRNGTPLSIFDGVPVAFKDMLAIKGYVTTSGSSLTRGDAPKSYDDLVVRRFRELGAIVLPPTSMTEFGVTPVGYGVHNGGPVNAHNTSYYSGGSSGGSSTAVALGICPIAIGYDGGGSVRTPAAFSGVYGMATGYGRFVFEAYRSSTMTKAGVFANSIADTMLGYAVLARDVDVRTDFYSTMYDGGNLGVPAAHLQSLLAGGDPSANTRDLSDVTVGVWYEWIEDAAPPVVAATKATLSDLRSRGATVKEFRIPNPNLARLAHSIKIASEFAIRWDRAYHDTRSTLEGNTRLTIGLGLALGAVEVLAAEKVRRYLFEWVRGVFFDGGIDVILTPTTPITAPAIPEGARAFGASNTPLAVELLKYVFLGNLLGLPGMSNPIGYNDDGDGGGGMPIGGLVTSWQWNEDKIFRVSGAIEDAQRSKRGGIREPRDKICLGKCDGGDDAARA